MTTSYVQQWLDANRDVHDQLDRLEALDDDVLFIMSAICQTLAEGADVPASMVQAYVAKRDERDALERQLYPSVDADDPHA